MLELQTINFLIEKKEKNILPKQKIFIYIENKYGFILNASFHNRFIIIDNRILYHFVSNFKNLGKKCFNMNKIEDINILNNLIKEIY